MKYVSTGTGRIPLISLLAILSVSLTVNLPGLAISPIEGKLDTVFTHVTDLEIQLLTVLPNLVIIPYVLFSGKLCTPRNQFWVLGTGLALYAASGVAYFFATSMVELIVISCILGMGCGLVVPLAASLVSQNFTGAPRVQQLGNKSGTSNFMVIVGTLFVGWICRWGWHLSFLIYLVPLLPLALMPFMMPRFIAKHKQAAFSTPATAQSAPSRPSGAPIAHRGAKLAGVIGLYVAATYATMVVSYYLPFTMQHYGLDTGQTGVATAMYFLSATIAGFTLTPVIRVFRGMTIAAGIAVCIAGLFITGLLHEYWSYVLGIFLLGFGYGLIQPIVYDKTTRLAPTTDQATRYFSYTLAGNYIAIAIVPFVVKAAEAVTGVHTVNFSYIFNGMFMIAVLVLALVRRKSFVFSA